MRTTIDIPDALAEEARAHLARTGRTLRDLVSEGLRLALAKDGARAAAFRLREARFDGTLGFAPGVSEATALQDLRDEEADRGPSAP